PGRPRRICVLRVPAPPARGAPRLRQRSAAHRGDAARSARDERARARHGRRRGRAHTPLARRRRPHAARAAPRSRDAPGSLPLGAPGAPRAALLRVLAGGATRAAAAVARGRGGMTPSLPVALRRAVSPYTGIVRDVEECLASTAEPRFFQASCEVGAEARLLGEPLGHLSGIGGAGRTRCEAAAAAVGEAVERYSATYVPHET